MPQHKHDVSDSGHTHTITDPGHAHTWVRQDVQINAGYRPWPANNNDCNDRNIDSGCTGGGQAHNNMPPYYALCYIMKT